MPWKLVLCAVTLSLPATIHKGTSNFIVNELQIIYFKSQNSRFVHLTSSHSMVASLIMTIYTVAVPAALKNFERQQKRGYLIVNNNSFWQFGAKYEARAFACILISCILFNFIFGQRFPKVQFDAFFISLESAFACRPKLIRCHWQLRRFESKRFQSHQFTSLKSKCKCEKQRYKAGRLP